MSPIVTVTNLSKCFKLYSNPRERVKEWIHPFRKKYHHPFWALDSLSFSINRGESLGIIGQNGCGKSTLLQIITGVMAPTLGAVETRGRIAALLELGTGFDAELTGRENLYLSGSLMGLSKKEIQSRIPSIEAFADIGEFIDQPVKLYSSGMFVRLAFSSAIHVDPDILIVDEALAVGDVKFQNKCYRKFHEFKSSGKTIIFVTHSTDLVAKHCDRALLLHQGQLKMDGTPNDVINAYLELLLGTDSRQQKKAQKLSDPSLNKSNPILQVDIEQETHPEIRSFLQTVSGHDQCSHNPTYNSNEHRYGSSKGKVIDYLVKVEDSINPLQVETSSVIAIYVKYLFFEETQIPIYGITLKTVDGVEIFGTNSLFEQIDVQPRQAGEVAVLTFVLPARLNSGEYFISIGLAEFHDGETPPIDRRYDMIHLKVSNNNKRMGILDLDITIAELG